MDFLAAYSAVNQGHNHPRIAAAMIEQIQTLALTSRAFRNDRLPPLLEKLCTLTGFDKALLMNSGAEAVETAIKAMRKWGYERKGIAAGQAEIIVSDGNFHGRTTTIVGLQHRPGQPPPASARSPRASGSCPTATWPRWPPPSPPTPAAIFMEPVQGEAGVVIPPPRASSRGCANWPTRTAACWSLDEIQSGLRAAPASCSPSSTRASAPTASPSARPFPAASTR